MYSIDVWRVFHRQELNYQRQSTNDYLKRTRMYFSFVYFVNRQNEMLSFSNKIKDNQFSLLAPKPIEHYSHNSRPPTNLTYRRVTPKTFSRRESYSPLFADTSIISENLSKSSRDTHSINARLMFFLNTRSLFFHSFLMMINIFPTVCLCVFRSYWNGEWFTRKSGTRTWYRTSTNTRSIHDWKIFNWIFFVFQGFHA